MTANLTLKGRKFYRNGELVAEIFGYREWFKGEPVGTYEVRRNGEVVATGFCYFKDAVKWVRDIIGREAS